MGKKDVNRTASHNRTTYLSVLNFRRWNRSGNIQRSMNSQRSPWITELQGLRSLTFHLGCFVRAQRRFSETRNIQLCAGKLGVKRSIEHQELGKVPTHRIACISTCHNLLSQAMAPSLSTRCVIVTRKVQH